MDLELSSSLSSIIWLVTVGETERTAKPNPKHHILASIMVIAESCIVIRVNQGVLLPQANPTCRWILLVPCIKI